MTQVTYKAELFPSKYRFVAVTADPGFNLGNCLLPLLAYLVPDWRIMYGSALFVFSTSLLLIFFFLPESLPWLVRMGREEEARRVLKKVAASRGEVLEEEEFARIVAFDEEAEKVGFDGEDQKRIVEEVLEDEAFDDGGGREDGSDSSS